MLNPDHNASPFNAVPPLVVALALVMAGIECWLSAGTAGIVGGPEAVGWRTEALHRFAFSGPLFHWMLESPGRTSVDILKRFVTYPFVNGSFTQMIFAVVITLGLGKFVGEIYRQSAVAVVWLASTVTAALAYAFLTGSQIALNGGMPPAYGLIGSYTFALWMRAQMTGQPPWMAFRLIGLLMLLQIGFGLVPGGGLGPQVVAEIAAFATGFIVSFIIRPGGLAALADRLRRR
jgi:rhomboid protease GluP